MALEQDMLCLVQELMATDLKRAMDDPKQGPELTWRRRLGPQLLHMSAHKAQQADVLMRQQASATAMLACPSKITVSHILCKILPA